MPAHGPPLTVASQNESRAEPLNLNQATAFASDDLTTSQARDLEPAPRRTAERACPRAGEVPTHDVEITPERAIELRNRKQAPLILMVPSGEGHAASSLDNSFQRVPVTALFDEVVEQLIAIARGTDFAATLRTLRGVARHATIQDWAEFLTEVGDNGSAFGPELWRLGLIPDYGTDPDTRLQANALGARALARPPRSTATVADRLVQAGLREDATRTRLRVVLDQQPSTTPEYGRDSSATATKASSPSKSGH